MIYSFRLNDGGINMIYADNAATTRLSPHALEVMTDVAQNAWGNPSSL